MVFVHGRPHIDADFEPVANDVFLCALDERRDEFIRNFFFDHDAAGCRAALAGGSERTRKRGFHRQLQIGVGENYHGIFAAHLALDFFQALRTGGVERAADLVRASERKSVNERILH